MRPLRSIRSATLALVALVAGTASSQQDSLEPSAPTTAAPIIAPQPSWPADVIPLLERAGRYVTGYEETFRNIVAEEVLTQWKMTDQGRGAAETPSGEMEWDEGGLTPSRRVDPPPMLVGRVLRADVVYVRLPGLPWSFFRDVYEVDGQKVRERQARLEALFVSPTGSTLEQANAILRESARYDPVCLWKADRTVNAPTLALLFLRPERQRCLEFTRGKDERRFEAARGIELRFVETTRPTLVHDASGSDLPATGRFWVDPVEGTVLRSEVVFLLAPGFALASIGVDYHLDPSLMLWLPSKMTERCCATTDATARYSNYRPFTVTTEDGVRPEP
jgi:hypothetical protein